MGSKTTQTQSQNTNGTSTSNPWQPAQPYLTGLLGQASGTYNANTGAPTNAGTLANQGMGDVSTLLSGSGLTDAQKAALSSIGSATTGFNNTGSTLTKYLTPYADGSQIGANNAPFQQALKASLDKARDTIGSQFAGAGRYGSAAMGNAEATQLGNVAAGATAQQYNSDVANQMSAIGQLESANNSGLTGNLQGATTSAGIGQQGVTNQLSGIGQIGNLNSGSWSDLNSYASLLAALGGMGGQTNSTGTSNGTGTSETSGAGALFGGLLGGAGAGANLFKSLGSIGLHF